MLNYFNAVSIKSANQISGMKLDAGYPDLAVPHLAGKIEVIPRNKAQLALGSSRVYVKGQVVDNKSDENIFIIQIQDTHYAPGLDLRAN